MSFCSFSERQFVNRELGKMTSFSYESLKPEELEGSLGNF
jgi:hypothetical protein